MANNLSPAPTSADAQVAGQPDMSPLATARTAAGFVAPVVGRVAKREVLGYFGFPLIRKGETVTPVIVSRAESMGRLYELIAATDEE